MHNNESKRGMAATLAAIFAILGLLLIFAFSCGGPVPTEPTPTAVVIAPPAHPTANGTPTPTAYIRSAPLLSGHTPTPEPSATPTTAPTHQPTSAAPLWTATPTVGKGEMGGRG